LILERRSRRIETKRYSRRDPPKKPCLTSNVLLSACQKNTCGEKEIELWQPAYQWSKAALNAITLMVADACRGNNVTVNSVCPGWTKTDLGGPDAPQSVGEAVRRRRARAGGQRVLKKPVEVLCDKYAGSLKS
jgi:NAD(P)-dependent dehydrogenase (short-subunit alcohol dehydrogenase family)